MKTVKEGGVIESQFTGVTIQCEGQKENVSAENILTGRREKRESG